MINEFDYSKIVNVFEHTGEDTKTISYSSFLEQVLKGIPDVIVVYRPDKTIMFLNEAGYEFYRTTPDEVNGKRCFMLLSHNTKCDNCIVHDTLKSKKTTMKEIYVSSVNKYMDCCCNPVLDNEGKIVLLVEQLRDVTKRKHLDKLLKESEEGYRKIVDLSPDAMIIMIDNEIVLANEKAVKLSGLNYSDIIGQSIYKFTPGYEKIISKRAKQLLIHKEIKTTFDYKHIGSDSKAIDIEASSSYLYYKGKPAIISILRDVTERKKELNAAAKLQKNALKKEFPFTDKAELQAVYIPARTVSGDYYDILKINDDLVIGIIADVSGKGITAALSISAFNVLFHESVLISNDPLQILKNLNNKIGDYLEDSYIAACCFSLDFKNNKAKVVGAGINEFIFQSSKNKIEERVVKGLFLGMFKDSIFDEQIIYFKKGDRFCFFSDGLEFIFDDKIKEIYLNSIELTEFRSYLTKYLKKMLIDVEGIKDDCTLLAIEIK
ncbi:SpoIIE family protein phosphatase [Clostridium sp. CS001]|uniref:SpoIIE family protein phosphatase n=1 Tax=Clostridium sp. CS001 TaxID=2880648 RepID=UPI001CF554CE|nr:SpoIIE family protein phosphatase [Clostridium sp. CS001]MCB2289382.1 SpoIIE family protein phosphatase [Clostridium sp. CS001]